MAEQRLSCAAVRARSGNELVPSAVRPVALVPSTAMLDDLLWLERDDDDDSSADAVFRVFGSSVKVLATAETPRDDQKAVLEMGDDHETVLDGEDQETEIVEYEEEDGEDQQAVLGEEDDDDEEMVEGTVYELTDREESDDDDGADDTDDEEEDEESDVTGFMRVAAADAENQEDGGGDSQILVLYRYTRFSAAWSDGSVEARGSTREHQLRFMAAAGHGARSLGWAGASLAHLIYPDGLCKKLRELWTGLASEVSLPPGAARVKVFVDVGILRPANCTQTSMRHMQASLKDMTARPWPARFTGMVLNLPEPMQCGHDEDNKSAHDNDTDDDQRPAKRRRTVAAGDDCSICFDQLEGDDIATWPGCGKPHVFHGRCLELAIESKLFCPICRRGLYNEPKF